jgi:putative DNA primase/helicase
MSTQLGGPPRIDRDKLLSTVDLSDIIGQNQQVYRDGREFRTMCPWHADTDPSLTIQNEKGFYHCFACGAHGTAIDWLMFQRGIDFRAACEALGALRETNVVPIAKAPKISKRAAEYRAIPVPPDVMMPNTELMSYDKDKPAIGKALRQWEYRNRDGLLLGIVARYKVGDDGEKTIRTWTYGNYPNSEDVREKTMRWRCRRWHRPYPLYGLQKLGEPGAAEKRIVIVSGEKTADAAQTIMPDAIVLTWPGGDDGISHADWEPLAGRNIVILWPDADISGRKAIDWLTDELRDLVGNLWLVNVDDPALPKGWDIADAVESGEANPAWLRSFITHVMPDGQQRIRKVPKLAQVTGALVDRQLVQAVEPPVDDYERPRMADPRFWNQHPCFETAIKGGENQDRLIKCEYNAALPFRYHPDLKGLLRLNNLTKKMEITRAAPWGDKPGEWKDSNTTRMCQWFNLMGLHFGSEMMSAAAECVAEEWSFNPIVDYLTSLIWDGTPRVENWLRTYAGADDTLYSREVGKRWLIGAVARGMRPGTQVDTMLVLEGREGTSKTSLLRTLGERYFTPLRGSIGASDGRTALQAATHWIIEFGELAAITKSDWETLKDFLTTTEETMRLAYRRNPERLFRSCVFAGTVNETDGGWLPPDGDHRRFWPVLTRVCDIPGLARDRDQLWAEARMMWEEGQHWWIKPSESLLVEAVSKQRDSRRFRDEWMENVLDYVNQPKMAHDDVLPLWKIAMFGVNIGKEKLDKTTQMRLSKIMTALGWTRDSALYENRVTRVWRRPASDKKVLF